MQSYATAKPSVGLLPSMGGLCFYDREWQLPWVPGSGFRDQRLFLSVVCRSEISVSVTTV